jgi:growth arrest-specific protein 8
LQKKGGDVPATDLESASMEELNQKIVTLEREKNKEEDYRNYMQLERVRSHPCNGA